MKAVWFENWLSIVRAVVPAIACGGYLHERLVGRRADQELTVEQVVRDLGGLPPQRCFYAWMAVEAVRQALLEGG